MLQKVTKSGVLVSTAVLSGLLIGSRPVSAENIDSQDNLALNTLSLSPVLLNHPMVETDSLKPAQLSNLKLDNDNARDVVNNLNNDANSDIAAGTDHLNGNAEPNAQADQNSNSTKPSENTSKHEAVVTSKNTTTQKTAVTSKNTTTQKTADTTPKEANNEENAKQKQYASFTLRGPKHDPLDVKQNSTSAASRNNTQSNEAQTNRKAQNMTSSNSSQQNNNVNSVQQNNANTSFVKATSNKTTQNKATLLPAHVTRESSYKALYLNSNDVNSNYTLPTISWIITNQPITPLPRDKKWPKVISNNGYHTNYRAAYMVEPAGLQLGVRGYYETNIIPTKDNLQLGFFHPWINNLQIDDSNLDKLMHNFKFNQGDLDVTSSEIDNFYNVILTKQGIHHLSVTLSRVCHIAKNGISGKILYKIQEL